MKNLAKIELTHDWYSSQTGEIILQKSDLTFQIHLNSDLLWCLMEKLLIWMYKTPIKNENLIKTSTIIVCPKIKNLYSVQVKNDTKPKYENRSSESVLMSSDWQVYQGMVEEVGHIVTIRSCTYAVMYGLVSIPQEVRLYLLYLRLVQFHFVQWWQVAVIV